MHLLSVQYNAKENSYYPYNLPLFRNFSEINFTKQVTIFVGENGTGKSTLLEAIVQQAQLMSIGFLQDERDPNDAIMREFSNCLRLSWKSRTRNGFFLNSESFIGYIKNLTLMKNEALENLRSIDNDYKNKSLLSKNLAKIPHAHTLADLKHLYGEGLEYRSHGESYLDFFNSRFKPNGLFILDEPEVPLSPLKQLTLISMIKQMINENSQFIIATHSPILMAFPDADIINLDSNPPVSTPFKELEHVKLTKAFLDNPERYLRHL